jgi:hypothetical protein
VVDVLLAPVTFGNYFSIQQAVIPALQMQAVLAVCCFGATCCTCDAAWVARWFALVKIWPILHVPYMYLLQAITQRTKKTWKYPQAEYLSLKLRLAKPCHHQSKSANLQGKSKQPKVQWLPMSGRCCSALSQSCQRSFECLRRQWYVLLSLHGSTNPFHCWVHLSNCSPALGPSVQAVPASLKRYELSKVINQLLTLGMSDWRQRGCTENHSSESYTHPLQTQLGHLTSSLLASYYASHLTTTYWTMACLRSVCKP